MATILTFSTSGHRRHAPGGEVRAEIIVFPRTDIRALRGWSAATTDRPGVADRAAAPVDQGDPA